ncbi:MAG TPA: protein kinase [Myxococcota bacterium]|nr:protein kinase [Myxococcota bacterium]
MSARLLGPPPGTGATVGPYRLLDKVGQGGLATVYRACGLEGEIVALKVMNPEKTTEEQVKRIEREFKAMRRADSPYVVEVITSGEHEGYPWLALEFVEGDTLDGAIRGILEHPAPERWDEVERLLRGLLQALAHIHGMGMVHRDLKPSNVMVTRDGLPKLTDFGSVKAPDAFTTNLTMAGHLVGTVAFMAPEQITEDRIDHRADLYALGATLYVMLTGRRAVEADSIAGYLAKHLMEDPRPPAEVDSLVPVKLSRICMRLMKKDPEQRFPSAEAVIEALDAPDEVQRIALQGREAALRQVELQLAGLRRGEGRAVALIGRPGSGRSAMLSAIEVAAAEAGLPCGRLDFPLSASIERGLMKCIPGKGSFRKRLRAGAVLLLDDLDQARDADIRTLEAILRDQDLQRSVLLYYSLEGAAGEGLPTATAELLDRLVSNLLLDPFESPLLCVPLSARQVVAMMRDHGLSGSAAATIGRRLHQHCRGYPREVRGQLATLEASAWLRRQPDGQLELTVPLSRVQDDRLPVPDTRRREILEIFEALAGATRRAVKAMSVLGQDVEATVLESMCSGAGTALLAPGAEAIVLRRAEGLHEIFRFSRPETRQVVYDQLSPEERASLHKKAADLLLARHQRRIGSIAENAAQHLLAAGEAGRAYPLLVVAAQRAARKRKLREARVLVEKALQVREWGKDELSDTLDPKLHQQALAVRGEVLLAMGRPEDARASLEAALQIAEQGVADPVLVEVRARLGMALVDLGRPAEGRAHLEAALSELDLGSPVRFPTTRSLADALVAEGRVDEATETWKEALAAAREEGSPGREGSCLLGIGELELRRGNPMTAARALEMSEGRLRQGRLVRPLAICLERLADLALLDGRFRACIARADEAIRLSNELDLLDVGLRARLHKAEALLSAGADDDTRALIQEVLRQERASLDLWSLTTLHHLALQTLGHASSEGIPSSETPPESPPSSVGKWELYRAWAMIRDGSTGAALTHAKRSGVASQGPGLAGVRMESLLCQATLGVEVGSELKELVQRSLSGMAPEMRRPFVERLRRLGIFRG